MNHANPVSTRPTATYRSEIRLTVKSGGAPTNQAKTYSDAGKEGMKARAR